MFWGTTFHNINAVYSVKNIRISSVMLCCVNSNVILHDWLMIRIHLIKTANKYNLIFRVYLCWMSNTCKADETKTHSFHEHFTTMHVFQSTSYYSLWQFIHIWIIPGCISFWREYAVPLHYKWSFVIPENLLFRSASDPILLGEPWLVNLNSWAAFVSCLLCMQYSMSQSMERENTGYVEERETSLY